MSVLDKLEGKYGDIEATLSTMAQCHGTDYQQQSGYLTLFRISRIS